MNTNLSKAPQIKSPAKKPWLPAHSSTTTLASQISRESSCTSLVGTRSVRSAGQRVHPRTITGPATDGGRLHKLGSVPTYLRNRNRPVSSPGAVEQLTKAEQMDSGVQEAPVEPCVVIETEEPAVFCEPKVVPVKRVKVAGRESMKLEQHEVIRKLSERVEELEQKSAAQIVLENRVEALDQKVESRIGVLEKQLRGGLDGKRETFKERDEGCPYREALLAQDSLLVEIRETLLSSVSLKRERRGTLDQTKLVELIKQLKKMNLDMKELVKTRDPEGYENKFVDVQASVQNLLDLGLEEKITGRIVYDKEIGRIGLKSL